MKPRIVFESLIAALSIAATASAQIAPFAVAKCDPETAAFTNIRLPQPVLANGKPLAAGIYQVRITTDRPTPAVGQSLTAECWVEFVNGGSVSGREVASVVSSEDIDAVAKGPGPKLNTARVDLLKGGESLRVWMNHAGTHYIVNLPVAR